VLVGRIADKREGRRHQDVGAVRARDDLLGAFRDQQMGRLHEQVERVAVTALLRHLTDVPDHG
jgi:hypothetical protein